MTEAATEATATETEENSTSTETQAETKAETQATKPTETVDFWKAKAREQEKRAKDNADAARRLAEIEDAQKTEAQKNAEALSKETDRANTAERRVSALTIAVDHKLTADDVDLLSSLPDEDAMRKLAERLAGQAEEQQKNGNRVPKEGTATKTEATTEETGRAFARSFFGGGS